MALVPLSYNARSLFRRRASTLLTVASVGATVAVLAGVLALEQGFSTLFSESGREDIAVVLRQGSTSEGQSSFPRDRAEIIIKGTREFAEDAEGAPMAGGETFLAVRMKKTDGGETNVPIRGVSPATFAIRGDEITILEGRNFEPGADEVIVGRALGGRIPSTTPGDVVVFNTTPFRVVGTFACAGPFESEIWGDVERMMEALERPVYNRIIARLRPGVNVEELAKIMLADERAPSQVSTEREYLSTQTRALSATLLLLGAFLAVIMGTAAVFTGTNTMLAAVSARTQEIGILLSLGFRPLAIFVSFLFESVLVGLLGGIVGCLMALPANGIRTGTTNFDTFTEIAFAFRVTPRVMITAVIFAMILGLIGGAWPAYRAARLRPTQALRRE